MITTGNHIWDKREIIDYFQSADGNQHSPARRLLRPANYAPELPGWGVYQGSKNDVPYAVINLQGRVFMASNDDPFRVADQLLKEIKAKVFLSMFTPKRRRRNLLWDGIWMAGSQPSSARTPTFRPPTSESCPAAPPTSPTSA